jgi:hypothetical protein
MSEFELDNLGSDRWALYKMSMGKIKASEKIDLIVASTFPHLKVKTRRKIMNALQKKSRILKRTAISLQEAFNKIGRGLNGK